MTSFCVYMMQKTISLHSVPWQFRNAENFYLRLNRASLFIALDLFPRYTLEV